MPGVFDPWPVNGRLAIDGAIVDPLPTAVVRERGASVVIASNVAGKEADADAALSELPGITQTMLRMINVSERELLTARLPLADVVVRPRVAANYSFDFSRIAEFVAEGERAAVEALDSVAGRGLLFS
jgi:NTE family protein